MYNDLFLWKVGVPMGWFEGRMEWGAGVALSLGICPLFRYMVPYRREMSTWVT